MYEVLYEVTSMSPYYYKTALVWIDKEYKRIIEREVFDTWEGVEQYANTYHAAIKFDGII